VFIPVGLNYDRVLEDRSQLLKLGERRRRGMLGAVSTTLTFIARNLWQMLSGNWHRFGYACVNFGSPLSMRRYVAMRGTDFPALDDEARRREVEALGRHLMQAIGGVIPVVPVALVAQVFGRDAARALSELEIKSAACDLLHDWEAHGAHIYIPRHDRDYAIGVGLRMLTLRHVVEERDGLFRAVPENLPVLAYYANSVAHFAGAVAQAVPLDEAAAAAAVT
jgi:glycerol-3-phosphate O-acyltransferase